MYNSNQVHRSIRILGAAWGIGARDRRCEDGPDTLRATGLVSRLRSRGIDVSWKDSVRPHAIRGPNPVQEVGHLCRRLAHKVCAVVKEGALPVVLGGDHTCAIGTWSGITQALQKRGPLGLIWIDAHMDSHTPHTTPSGALHGMPLACLLGYGEPALTPSGDGDALLLPQHVCLIGVRSFEPEEAALLKHLGVRIFTMEDIVRKGLDAVFREAVNIVRNRTAGFGVTIDLDAVDPEDAPGTGLPVPGGIRAHELATALAQVAGDPSLLAVEIAEFNPHLDKRGVTAEQIGTLLDAVLGGKREALPSVKELEWKYGAHHYDPLPVVLVKGEGVYLWDEGGRRYLDMMSAYSAVSHGHCHPRLVRALTEQARTLAVTSRAFHNNRLPLFLKRLCELTGQDQAIPANTGLEAVEAALKAARKWAHQVKGVPRDKAEIISCEGNFHGRSIAILAMSSEPRYKEGFGPFPPGFVTIPYGDADALARAITSNTAAFLVEPVQGEGGIIVPPRGYLAECARICKERGVLLICDEVQTGLGRTGKFLACEHEAVQPDGVILGKALGGGLIPVSAFLARREVMQVFTPGDHGSTFGGTPLAAAVGIEALNVLVEEQLVERAAELGKYLLGNLRAIRSPLIREVRGIGLLIGIEIDPAGVSARKVCEQLLARGILSKDTHETVVRFSPPLVITREQIDWAVGEIRRVFEELGTGLRRAA